MARRTCKHGRRKDGKCRKKPARGLGGSSSRTPVRLGYDTYNIFQRYWWGMGDPLYAVLSRRGNSVDWVTVKASSGELDRLCDTARDAAREGDKIEKRVGRNFFKRHPKLCKGR